jgi:hypothetical protein
MKCMVLFPVSGLYVVVSRTVNHRVPPVHLVWKSV